MVGRILLLSLFLLFLLPCDAHDKRPIMNIIPLPYPQATLARLPFEHTTIQVPCKESWTANWCYRCHNAFCRKHCEDCGLEWGTRTVRCDQYGYHLSDVRHTCLLLESKATERMPGGEKGATWESMAFECRKCEGRLLDYSHEANPELVNAKPDPIPKFSNAETTRQHIMY
ncbi:hypothetical protein PRIPAC_88076 [Pristionchus pacificus]|uniref:Uncharacterized protein n=1 Tax=Pristionchus pacificus TaxID=54126 RepID=A0A2A6B3J4_PRIPA|nr:hypothetical protein PRIPAC_88076 [Pristionchus pacificus]|eukprot:PDM60449.1 hypothetical protein PRIPAC_53427 [Pristionchus pacificus]